MPPSVKPPPINETDLAHAVKVTQYVTSNTAISDELKSALYYPLQQVPLASFQKEMLVWTTDKLKLFQDQSSGIPLEFLNPEIVKNVPSLEEIEPEIKYKRADEFTVLAIVPLQLETCVVFTSEVAQKSWEIIGVFGLRHRNKVLNSSPGLAKSYDAIEDGFESPQSRSGEPSEEAEYWNRYAENEPTDHDHHTRQEIVRSEKRLKCRTKNEDLESPDNYWNRLARQPVQISNGEEGDVVVRNDVVALLVNLAELYIDTGAPNKQLIIDDIMAIAMGSEARMKIGVPLVAHRHAIRTIRWITRDGTDISAEANEAIRKIELY